MELLFLKIEDGKNLLDIIDICNYFKLNKTQF